MNITFFLPTVTQPRFHKRIYSLKEQNSIKVYAFDRGLYKKNALNIESLHILGKMANKNYFKRFSVYLKLAKAIVREKNGTDLYYFFTIDFALLGYLFLKKNQYVYEIGDFAYLSLPKPLVKLLTSIDLRIVKKSYKTVLTSEGFKSYLNRKSKSELNKLLVIPNKPPKEIRSFPRKTDIIESPLRLRFGFVGILRYRETIYKFVNIIAKHFPNFEFVFYGAGGLIEDFIQLSKEYPNIQYKGEFKNPADLGRIYNDFDIHIACYDVKGLNQRLAEPNKYYESVYFGNPLVATKDSFFGDNVEKLALGFTIDDFSEERIIAFLHNLTADKLNHIRKNMLDINEADLIYSDEELVSVINNYKINS